VGAAPISRHYQTDRRYVRKVFWATFSAKSAERLNDFDAPGSTVFQIVMGRSEPGRLGATRRSRPRRRRQTHGRTAGNRAAYAGHAASFLSLSENWPRTIGLASPLESRLFQNCDQHSQAGGFCTAEGNSFTQRNATWLGLPFCRHWIYRDLKRRQCSWSLSSTPLRPTQSDLRRCGRK
jgi:hypothetical protein